MVFSPLTDRVIPTRNKFGSRNGESVVRVIQHHWAGTRGGIERMMDPDAEVSTNYLILSDGTIIGQVPEELRAWTSGSSMDRSSITIEMQNESTYVHNRDNMDPRSWPVTDEAASAAIALYADIAARYGWGGVPRSRVIGHQDTGASTSCPGGYVYSRLGPWADLADKRLRGSTAAGGDKTPLKDEEIMFDYYIQAFKPGTRTIDSNAPIAGYSIVKDAAKIITKAQWTGLRDREAQGAPKLIVTGIERHLFDGLVRAW